MLKFMLKQSKVDLGVIFSEKVTLQSISGNLDLQIQEENVRNT